MLIFLLLQILFEIFFILRTIQYYNENEGRKRSRPRRHSYRFYKEWISEVIGIVEGCYYNIDT